MARDVWLDWTLWGGFCTNHDIGRLAYTAVFVGEWERRAKPLMWESP